MTTFCHTVEERYPELFSRPWLAGIKGRGILKMLTLLLISFRRGRKENPGFRVALRLHGMTKSVISFFTA
jgi:hypothetical protein